MVMCRRFSVWRSRGVAEGLVASMRSSRGCVAQLSRRTVTLSRLASKATLAPPYSALSASISAAPKPHSSRIWRVCWPIAGRHARRGLRLAVEMERAVDGAQAIAVDELRQHAVGLQLRVGDVVGDAADDAEGDAGRRQPVAPVLPGLAGEDRPPAVPTRIGAVGEALHRRGEAAGRPATRAGRRARPAAATRAPGWSWPG